MNALVNLLAQIAISAAAVTIYHLWVTRGGRPAASTPTPAPPPPAPVRIAAPPEQLPPEIIAVISAAIAVALGRPHRVLTVEQPAMFGPEINIWAMEGRVEQFMSHRVR